MYRTFTAVGFFKADLDFVSLLCYEFIGNYVCSAEVLKKQKR